MKKLMFGLLAIVGFTAIISWKDWENIQGSGNLKKETREVGSFSGIESRGSMNVVISYGNSNQITVEADDNLLPLIETKVDGKNLVIKSKDKTGFSTKNKITIAVQMKAIDKLSVSGSGNINGNGNFDGSNSQMSVSGSGNIKLGFLSFDKLSTSISGSGNIKLTDGKINSVDASISGSGQMDAVDVPCNNVIAHISGSGGMKITANNSIEARISGSGSIHYKGNATNVIAKTSGSGKVVKM